MPRNTYKKSSKGTKKSSTRSKVSFSILKDRRVITAAGLLIGAVAVFLSIAFLSYLFTGKADQSVLNALSETGVRASGAEIQNRLGLLGAWAAHAFIFKWFGIGAFLFIPILAGLSIKLLVKNTRLRLRGVVNISAFFLFWITLSLGYLTLITNSESTLGFICGGIGYSAATLLDGLVGWGTALIILLSLGLFLIFRFNINDLKFSRSSVEKDRNEPEQAAAQETVFDTLEMTVKKEETLPSESLTLELNDHIAPERLTTTGKKDTLPVNGKPKETDKVEEPELSIVQVAEESSDAKKVENYDPTLDLPSYKYPEINLLNEYENTRARVTKEELEANKNRIVETLGNYSIGIRNIKATIGPTVTLYEIVPEAGVRISKIKNLEDDIALSLSALGIRIIAPIPGRGTVGIEVPNKNSETVSLRSVLFTDKFLKSNFELPVALGKTISNEVYVADLAKMPHLLMAGATGQGKSVGLNVILASLIYKKHPSQLKFVLVDPKKVELTLFNKIERHFLAKLPDTEDAIITDTKKVIHTLNSLCIEMDQRYNLLKDGSCRNLKEYNAKFVARRLNPEKGHRFLPYIVLVIDELADLMMTAGKEVETPIARLAQLARAIGIHLVVATQRPSVNVITGIIKANFPARLSFKVTSKVDSRTILDTGGADQLIGKGDMLLSASGSELTRLQCAFVDTPEIERICDFIGSQRGYDDAYLLPEYIDDEGSSEERGAFSYADRDALFEEAARVIVTHQQGSTSLVQRKLSLGYNRAGRIIDQLEATGIVGPFEGSKARQVLIPDEYSLEQFLSELENK